MGGLARAGRDKLTLLTSPSLSQLRPVGGTAHRRKYRQGGPRHRANRRRAWRCPPVYGDDRAFVVLRLSDDDNAALDGGVDGLRGNQPIMVRELADRLELGAEMYCWEVATALAGVVLAINPFDQPNVQESKDNTARVLEAGETDPPPGSTVRPASSARSSARPGPGDYVAIQAYLPPTERGRAPGRPAPTHSRHPRVATTVGLWASVSAFDRPARTRVGPRAALSPATYQPDDRHRHPRQPFSFGTLFAAQALGDLRSLRGRGLRVARSIWGHPRPRWRRCSPIEASRHPRHPSSRPGGALIMQLGFIGLGRMGGNMVHRLRAAVTTWWPSTAVPGRSRRPCATARSAPSSLADLVQKLAAAARTSG